MFGWTWLLVGDEKEDEKGREVDVVVWNGRSLEQLTGSHESDRVRAFVLEYFTWISPQNPFYLSLYISMLLVVTALTPSNVPVYAHAQPG